LANGNGGSANAYLDKVVSGQATDQQTTARLGAFTFPGRGWSSYDYVPLRDQFGNLVTVTLNGQATLRLVCGPQGGGVNVNFLFLVPARTDLPSISGVYPDGTTLLQGTNKLAFSVSNPTYAIDPSGIQVTLNGADVSSQLVITGNANNRSATLGLVPNFTNYAAVIRVTDANSNTATTTVYFDTFAPNSLTFEAEDYDYQNGQFLDNSDPGSFAGFIGVLGNDYYTDQANPPSGATYLYRPDDSIASQVCTDTPLSKFVAAQLANPALRNYNIGWWLGGQWMKFTRTYAAGNYFIYGRLSSGNGMLNVQCENITAGNTLLGTFTARGRGWALYDWVPLVDANHERVTVNLSGSTTLRITSDGNANANLFVAVPAVTAAAPVQVEAAVDQGRIVLSFPTVSGSNYKVYYKNGLTDSTWSLLTMVAGDGSVKSVSDSISGPARFYRLQIQ
jgi:hypothetical protein